MIKAEHVLMGISNQALVDLYRQKPSILVILWMNIHIYFFIFKILYLRKTPSEFCSRFKVKQN